MVAVRAQSAPAHSGPESHGACRSPLRRSRSLFLHAARSLAQALQNRPQQRTRRDRDVPLSPALLEELRGYWRWMNPKTFLFSALVDGWRADVPITDKVVWFACQSAARAAGIEKHISRPTLPHSYP